MDVLELEAAPGYGGINGQLYFSGPPPPNDNIADATDVEFGVLVSGTLFGAGLEPDEYIQYEDVDPGGAALLREGYPRSVWYRYVAPDDAAFGVMTFSFDALGLSGPTLIYPHASGASPDTVANLADPSIHLEVDGGGGYHNWIDPVTAGQTYYLQVIGYRVNPDGGQAAPSEFDLVIEARALSAAIGSTFSSLTLALAGYDGFRLAAAAGSSGSRLLGPLALTLAAAEGRSGSHLQVETRPELSVDTSAGHAGGSLRMRDRRPGVRRAVLVLQEAAGDSGAELTGAVDGSVLAGFTPAAGQSTSTLSPRGLLALILVDAAGASAVSGFVTAGHLALRLRDAAGRSGSTLGYAPDLSDNPPIELCLNLSGQYVLYPPAPSD